MTPKIKNLTNRFKQEIIEYTNTYHRLCICGARIKKYISRSHTHRVSEENIVERGRNQGKEGNVLFNDAR